MAIETRSLARIRLLLVDDEANVVSALRRTLSRLCPSWIIHTATSVVEACRVFEANPGAIDVVVADMQMPGYSGDQLLEALARGRPDVVRITLSGMLNPRTLLMSAKYAERRLCKPCPPERLRDEIIGGYMARRRTAGGTGGIRRSIPPPAGGRANAGL